MIVEATQAQVRSILGAMCRVAAPPSPADRAAIQAAYRYVFRGTDPLDVDALTPTSPEELARALPDPSLAQSAVRFLAVMALVDGRLDQGKIALVERYASALGIHEHYLRQLAEAAAGHLDWVGMDMMRQNVRSIPGLAWNPADVTAIFLPYAGAHADPALARRYQGSPISPTARLAGPSGRTTTRTAMRSPVKSRGSTRNSRRRTTRRTC